MNFLWASWYSSFTQWLNDKIFGEEIFKVTFHGTKKCDSLTLSTNSKLFSISHQANFRVSSQLTFLYMLTKFGRAQFKNDQMPANSKSRIPLEHPVSVISSLNNVALKSLESINSIDWIWMTKIWNFGQNDRENHQKNAGFVESCDALKQVNKSVCTSVCTMVINWWGI